MLREIRGHSSVTVPERYLHLRADLFKREDLMKFDRDITRTGASVIDPAAHRLDGAAVGHAPGTGSEAD